MMQHYDIDALVQYGSEEIPGTLLIINPAWRALDKQCKDMRRRIQRLQAKLGATTMHECDIQKKAEQIQDIQALQKDKDELLAKRRKIKRKVPLST